MLAALTIVPIVTVFLYSLVDNVIVNPNPPVFVGLENYEEVLTHRKFRGAFSNTMYFSLVSVAAHFVIGLSFALLLNSRLLSNNVKALFRVIYILPWVFTASIIAILWRLLMNPHGVINFVLLELGLVEELQEFLSDRRLALNAVTFINIWSGYPFYLVSFLAGLQGIPDDLYEAGTSGRRQCLAAIPQHYTAATEADHHQPGLIGLYLDDTSIYFNLDDHGRRPHALHRGLEYIHL